MHEVSLCESILRIIENQGEKDGFSKVLEVTLTVGDRSGASREALAFCFPLVAKGTIAEGAQLVMQESSGSELRVSKLEVE